MRPKKTLMPINYSRRGVMALTIGAVSGALLAGAFAAPSPAWAQAAPQAAPSSILSASDAYAQAESGAIVLVDIRRPDEWAETGIAQGAVALDMREDAFVAQLVTLRQTYPDTPIALICRTGNRSEYVVSTLAGQGFPGLADVSEGMAGGRNGTGWIPAGLPIYEGNAENIAAALATKFPE